MGRKKKAENKAETEETPEGGETGRDQPNGPSAEEQLENWIMSTRASGVTRSASELAALAMTDDGCPSLVVDEDEIRAALQSLASSEAVVLDEKGRLLPTVPGGDAEAEASAVPAAPPSASTPRRTRYLSCRLTPKERGHISRQVTKQLEQHSSYDLSINAAKEHLKDLKSRQKLCLSEAIKFGAELRDGRAYRDVECVEIEGDELHPIDASKPRKGMLTKRTDTDEAIDWRELRADERQGDLFSDRDSTAA